MTGPWPAYALRMALAGTFILAGLDHAVSDGGMAWAVRWFPWPEAAGLALAWGELAIGLGLAAGALFPFAAGAAGFVAAGAALTVMLGDGAFLWQDFLMLGAATYVLANGPGPAAVDDALVARWPRLARWLRPLRGEAARRAGLRALQACLGLALLGVFAWGIARGEWTSPSGARLSPAVGLAYFAARPLAGALVLAGAAPRVAGALMVFAGLVNLSLAPLDYHPYVPLVLGLAWMAWPEAFAARPVAPLRAPSAALCPAQLLTRRARPRRPTEASRRGVVGGR